MPEGGEVTSREVYQLILALKAEVLAEIRSVSTEWHGRLTSHEHEHRREHDVRSSRIRWAVTTIVAVVLGAASIVVALVT